MVIMAAQVADNAAAKPNGGAHAQSHIRRLAGSRADHCTVGRAVTDGAGGSDRRAREEASQDKEAADAGANRRARADEEVRRRMERSQGRRQDGEGNEVAAILERLQQAPQSLRLNRRTRSRYGFSRGNFDFGFTARIPNGE